jgi:hypothetical protein
MSKGSDYFLSISAEINVESVQGMSVKLDDIYDPDATIKYYNEDEKDD